MNIRAINAATALLDAGLPASENEHHLYRGEKDLLKSASEVFP